MKKAEYPGNGGCLQRDSAEHEEYAGARSADRRETEETDGADLLKRILDRDNLNRAYKRVKTNKGAPGIDEMTVEDALPWLREHKEEILDQIRNGKYKPQPVRRKEIPKPDGGIRKLGIPTVVDRIIQQAIAQQLTPIYEPLFSDGSYGYRPGRSAQMAIQKVKEYAEQGYTTAVGEQAIFQLTNRIVTLYTSRMSGKLSSKSSINPPGVTLTPTQKLSSVLQSPCISGRWLLGRSR